MAAIRGALLALLLLFSPARGKRRGADPALPQRRPGAARFLAARDRDDRRPRRECLDQPRHLPRFPDPLPRPATAAACGSASPSKAPRSTAGRCRRRWNRSPTGCGSGSATPTSSWRSATTATSSVTGRRASSAASTTSTSSTGTPPATAGNSRSTRPRRGSACPRRRASASARPIPGRRARPEPMPWSPPRRPGDISFRTTRPLGPYEGLTVAVAFPKGVVAEPGESTRAMLVARRLRPAGGRRPRPARPARLSITSPGSAPGAIHGPEPSSRSSPRPTG